MTRKRHTEGQIIAVTKDVQAGLGGETSATRTTSRIRPSIIPEAKYAGPAVTDMKKLRQLEQEKRRLKPMVEEEALDVHEVKAPTAKHW